jgi:hypothetical protein
MPGALAMSQRLPIIIQGHLFQPLASGSLLMVLFLLGNVLQYPAELSFVGAHYTKSALPLGDGRPLENA